MYSESVGDEILNSRSIGMKRDEGDHAVNGLSFSYFLRRYTACTV